MPFSYDIATENIVRHINKLADLESKKQQAEFSMALEMRKQQREEAKIKEERAYNEKIKGEDRVYTEKQTQQKQEYIDPWQRVMAKEYLQSNPEADISGMGNPTFDAIQSGVQRPPAIDPFAASSPQQMSGQQLAEDFLPANQAITMTPQGPKQVSGKDAIFQNIIAKQRRGETLYENEKKFASEYLQLDKSDKKKSLNSSEKPKIAINPKTGEKLQLKDGQWVPLQ